MPTYNKRPDIYTVIALWFLAVYLFEKGDAWYWMATASVILVASLVLGALVLVRVIYAFAKGEK